jgi:hypothetical protein
VCGSHDGDEILLLLLCGSDDDLSYGHDNLLPLSGGSNLLLIDGEVGCAARHGRQDSEG